MSEKYWTPHRILTHNRLFNVIIGQRSIGKTTGALLHCVKKFQECGSTFVYMRRTQADIDDVEKSLFDNVNHLLEGENYLMVKDGVIKMLDMDDGSEVTCGWCVGLSTVSGRKSKVFKDCDWIVYDEFLSPAGNYLKDEIKRLNSAYVTIARKRNTRVLLLANNDDIGSPYHRTWDINRMDMKDIRVSNTPMVAVEYTDDSYTPAVNDDFKAYLEATDPQAYRNEMKNHYMQEDYFRIGTKKNPTAAVAIYHPEFIDGDGVAVDMMEGKYYCYSIKGDACGLRFRRGADGEISIDDKRRKDLNRALRVILGSEDVCFDSVETYGKMMILRDTVRGGR